MDNSRPTIGFIGAGRTARVLAVGLVKQCYDIVAISSRTRTSAGSLAKLTPRAVTVESAQAVADAAELVFITTPDDAIGLVASHVVWRPGQAVVHTSGALTLAPLAFPATTGARIGSFHPVHTFNDEPDPDTEALRGATFGIEAQNSLFNTLAEMAKDLGGRPIWVPAEARELYHAAAVMVCGYFVGIFNDAVNVWQMAGLPSDSTHLALTHLVQATLNNLKSMGVEASQSGPVSRGDIGTVLAHLNALEAHSPELSPVYSALAGRAVGLAISSGRLSHSALPQWRQLLT